MVSDNFDEVIERGSKVPELEVKPQDLYHAHSFWTKWIFCQDAKVIGIQYSMVAIGIGLVAMVLSWIMRLQLGFHYAWNDYGNLFTNRFISWGFWKFSNSFDGWCKRYGFSLCKYD